MDLSKQTNDSFASASVYFDADSTVSSSSAFKTLEALSDISNISAAGAHNSTLEAKFKEQVQLKTMQKTTASPMYAKSKNILQEFRAQCSTPTHAQLLRTVDVNRGSDASLCMDLGTAFTTMEDDDKMPNLMIIDENKENALPDRESGEGSTLLTSSSVEVVTVIDRNKTTLSKANEDLEEQENSVKTVQSTTQELPKDEQIKEVRFKENLIENRNAPLKARHSLLPARITRKSLCEPDLKNNRPSRISMAATNPTQRRIPPPKAFPLLKPELNTLPKNSTPLPNKEATTKINAPAAKRAFPYAARMSVMVKTTLNSPARKLMRRSVVPSKKMGASITAPRRSVMPVAREAPNSGTTTTAKLPAQRRSFLPTKLKPLNSAPQLTIPETTGSVKSTPCAVQQKKEELEYVCVVCKTKYRIKSLYDAHKRSHENGTPAVLRKANSTQGSTNSLNRNNTPQCKYCDKKFALVRALHIHLLENCTKIPPLEKRKLEYTEMAHVEKAQLPTFSHHSGQNSSQASSGSSLGVSKSNSTVSATEFRANSKESAVIAHDLVKALSVLDISPPVNEDKAKQMAPPSTTKVKKNNAHMGVYRTPTKLVTCHLCKLHFRDVLEYTHHTMTKHQTDNADTSLTK